MAIGCFVAAYGSASLEEQCVPGKDASCIADAISAEESHAATASLLQLEMKVAEKQHTKGTYALGQINGTLRVKHI